MKNGSLYTIKHSIIHNNTVHLQRSKPKVYCYNCGKDHFIKDCPKPKSKRKTSYLPNTEQKPSISMTISTNLHIPLGIWNNINKQLAALKLIIIKLTSKCKKQFCKSYKECKMYTLQKTPGMNPDTPIQNQ